MSESRNLLRDTAEDMCRAIGDASFAEGWPQLVEAGFPSLLVAEDSGGFGGDFGDALAVLRIAGARALPLPLAECVIATYVARAAGLDVGDDSLSIAVRVIGERHDGRFSGTLHTVPWGRDVDRVVAVINGMVALLPVAQARVEHGDNPAGEPRDKLTFERVRIDASPCATDLQSLAAFTRIAQADGATSAALALTIEHANVRVQFGKPLAKLQAVQQTLAVAAEECAAARAAAEGLVDALDRGDAQWETAAAKLRTNIAMAAVISIAHQVHGAIGFTQEYPLHRLTRRMMGWRSEYGNDRFWAERLGALACADGGAALWAEITRRSDH